MDQDEFLVITADPKFESNRAIFYWIRSWLFALFGKYQLGSAHAIATSKFLYGKFPTFLVVYCSPYYMAVSLIDMARVTNEAKFLRHAKKMVKKIEGFAAKKNPTQTMSVLTPVDNNATINAK